MNKKTDLTHRYPEHPDGLVTTGTATMSTYAELSKAVAGFENRILSFVKGGQKYCGNPE